MNAKICAMSRGIVFYMEQDEIFLRPNKIKCSRGCFKGTKNGRREIKYVTSIHDLFTPAILFIAINMISGHCSRFVQLSAPGKGRQEIGIPASHIPL